MYNYKIKLSAMIIVLKNINLLVNNLKNVYKIVHYIILLMNILLKNAHKIVNNHIFNKDKNV